MQLESHLSCSLQWGGGVVQGLAAGSAEEGTHLTGQGASLRQSAWPRRMPRLALMYQRPRGIVRGPRPVCYPSARLSLQCAHARV